MTTKKILKTLSELNGFSEAITNPDSINSLEEIEKSISNLKTLQYYLRIKKLMFEIEPKKTDIYVQTEAKSGTTLVQMMLYQMITDGNMDFEHLYDVSPWYGFLAREKSTFETYLNNPPQFERKILKFHAKYEMFKELEKGKIVYVIRDGKDQLLSSYHQHINYFGYKGDLGSFVDKYMENWFKMNEAWLKNEYNLPIIYINYEDIINDKRAIIFKLSAFLDIPVNEEIVERTIERSSFSFMKKHENKFGEQPKPKDTRVYNQFIRKGKAGQGEQYFTKEQLDRYSELSKKYLNTHKVSKRYFGN